MAGIYFHIPFCRQACHYCDFHFSTNTSSRQAVIEAMIQEMDLRHDYLGGEVISTLYFGGGTPSMLSHKELSALLSKAYGIFQVSDDAEITLEANPDDLSADYLRGLKDLRINRLSIGIQSFHDPVLKFLNRVHDGRAAVETFYAARAAGFDNINIDLIYAIPGVDTPAWQQQLQHTLELKPEHVSAYSLTIEPRTVFGHRAARGKLVAPPDDLAATQLEVLAATFEQAGYEHYEVSNFCLPGRESKHNSSYWKRQPYLGIGPSAHSYDRRARQHNVANNHVYARSMADGVVPAEVEVLAHADHVNDYLLTTLRTKWGSDLAWLATEFGYDIPSAHGPWLESLLANRFAVLEGDTLRLTRKGLLIADEITSRLFLEA